MWPMGLDGLSPHFTSLATDTLTRTYAHKDTPSRAVLSTPVRAKMQGISFWILAYTIKYSHSLAKLCAKFGHACAAFRRGE